MVGRALRDIDVRQSLEGWLAASHDPREARILHELKVLRPSARIDLALVNGELTGYEIKSDVDSLSRLHGQIPACNSVFDRAYIVVTGRHIRSCLKKIPSWWGIIVACEHSGEIFVSQIRESRLNTEWCIKSSLHLLTKPELQRITVALCDRRASRSMRHADLVDNIAMHCDPYFVRKSINEMLKARSYKF